MLTGIKVQIAAESWIVIGRLCCYLHFYPGQNNKCPKVSLRGRVENPRESVHQNFSKSMITYYSVLFDLIRPIIRDKTG